MKNKLTLSQEIIYDCIKKYYAENLEMPTLDEICELAELQAKSTVHAHLRILQRKGYIRIIPKIKRGIRFINNN